MLLWKALISHHMARQRLGAGCGGKWFVRGTGGRNSKCDRKASGGGTSVGI